MEKFAVNDKVLFKMPGNPIIKGSEVIRPDALLEGKIFEILKDGDILIGYGIELLTDLPRQEEGVCLNEYLPFCPGIKAGFKVKVAEEKILEKVI